jgi:hypothetical protein
MTGDRLPHDEATGAVLTTQRCLAPRLALGEVGDYVGDAHSNREALKVRDLTARQPFQDRSHLIYPR